MSQLFQVAMSVPLQIPEPGCQQDPSMTIATCPVGNDYLFGSLYLNDQIFQRGTAAFKVSFLLPNNQIKVGADLEWNTYSDRFIYSAGQREFIRFRSARDLNGDGVNDREMYRQVATARMPRSRSPGSI